METITVSGLVSITIWHETKLIELEYFRSATVEEIVKGIDKLKARDDWSALSKYQFKAEY